MTILEVLVVLSLFSVVGLLAYSALYESGRAGRRVDGQADASDRLAKAVSFFSRDLASSRYSDIRRATVPSFLSSAASDGVALWFLSAVDPATGELARKFDGEPMWQKNVLYYLVSPSQHLQNFGLDCAGHTGPVGVDDACPHKVLVRKVIDAGDPTTPLAEEEELLDDVAIYLTRPNGTGADAFPPQARVVEARIIATGIGLFDFELSPNAPRVAQEIRVSLSAANLGSPLPVGVGSNSLIGSGVLIERKFSAFPQN